jgi:hypothetical protein
MITIKTLVNKGIFSIPTNYLEVSSIYKPAGIIHPGQLFGREGNCKPYHLKNNENPCTSLRESERNNGPTTIHNNRNRNTRHKIPVVTKEDEQLIQQLKQRCGRQQKSQSSYLDVEPIDGGMD